MDEFDVHMRQEIERLGRDILHDRGVPHAEYTAKDIARGRKILAMLVREDPTRFSHLTPKKADNAIGQ